MNRQELDSLIARTTLSEIVGRAVQLERQGRDHWALCPFHSERTPSFKVDDQGGFFHCFGCGAHGDAIEFLRRVERLTFPDAVQRLAEDCHNGSATHMRRETLAARVDRERERRQSLRWIQNVLDSSIPAIGTLVETYLRHRGIQGQIPTALRFVPDLRYAKSDLNLPAMVAAVQQVDGSITGLHRTFLSPDGRGKADVRAPKMMFGTCFGGAVRLAPTAERLGVAEGIETALAVMDAIPELPVWAALSIGNIAGPDVRHARRGDRSLRLNNQDLPQGGRATGLQLPAEVREVVLVADADNADPSLAEAQIRQAADRFAKEGRVVRIMRPPQGLDFNDVLVGRLPKPSEAP